MKRYPGVSICISTYNWPAALELCLQSVLRQTILPGEVIIGDDGSGPETKELVERFRKVFTVPVHHIWQPDDGFKLAQIRNRSFAKASQEYMIQIDGDLVLHRNFIEDHLRFARRGSFISGARSLLTPESSNELLREKNIDNIPAEYALKKKHNAKRFLPLARLNFQLQKGASQVKYVLGANMSFWREDILAVNGYNEDFKGWGKEDNDLAARLANKGIQLHLLKFAAVIYHLYHTEAARDAMQQNELLLMESVRQRQVFVANGLNKYLK